jgi:hypothetical protein
MSSPGRQAVRQPMRPATNGFSGFSAAPKKASWDELARERESDGETKNYNVPPELIELARANRKGRGQVGTLTPLAPKPPNDVVVEVPPAAPLNLEVAPSSSAPPESWSRAPSVAAPPEGANHEPDSAPTVIQVIAAPDEPSAAEASPFAELIQSELAAGGEVQVESRDSTGVRRSSRRSVRRARRSSRVQMPLEATVAARAAAGSPRPQSYFNYATGAVLVGAYLVLCYYVNAFIAGLP